MQQGQLPHAACVDLRRRNRLDEDAALFRTRVSQFALRPTRLPSSDDVLQAGLDGRRLGGEELALLMPDTASVGASGGILGLVGFLLVVGVRHRGSLPADFAKSIIRSVLFMAALGFLAKDYIDNAAHAGGFLVGCVIALPLSGNVRELGRYPDRGAVVKAGWAAVAVLGVATIWVLVRLAVVAKLGATG